MNKNITAVTKEYLLETMDVFAVAGWEVKDNDITLFLHGKEGGNDYSYAFHNESYAKDITDEFFVGVEVGESVSFIEDDDESNEFCLVVLTDDGEDWKYILGLHQ